MTSHLDPTTLEEAMREIRVLRPEVRRLKAHDAASGIQWRAQYERANKAEAEVERLTRNLKIANSQAEHFEREWYLRGDEIDRLNALLADVLKETQGLTMERIVLLRMRIEDKLVEKT